ncbi:MAG: NAD(+)/NADH kinase, partial [Lachnospiraceae bacterium]|nr:NAD(+)/NADH kinase [Lachnospiraceae bacterium]
MKYFYLITNEVKDPQGQYTERITAYLEARGGVVTCVDNTAEAIRAAIHEPRMESSETADCSKNDGAECVLVLGGDGTVLRAARNIMDSDIPLLGVNLGTLGYLAEVEIGNIEQALSRLLADDYTREERMMLEGLVETGEQTEENYALND